MRTKLALLLLSSALAFTGCKKKEAATTEAAGSGSAAKVVEAQPGNDNKDPSKADPSNDPNAPADPNKPAEPASANPAVPSATKDLLTTAKESGKFTTLIKAVDAAGLTQTLSGAGPFTLLAPTDDAFAKLPPKDLEALLADKTKLEALLQYHVVQGALPSKDISGQKTLKTVAGTEVAVDAASGIKLGGATVITPDIQASNGVIHAIDTVLTPPAK